MRFAVDRSKFVKDYLEQMFDESMHLKRIASLANGTLGVMGSGSLAVSVIGQALAQARGLHKKHAVKQVDRLLSNQGIVVWDMFPAWVAEAVGKREKIVVAMDWTDFVLRQTQDEGRRSDDARAIARHQPRPGDALDVAHRPEGRIEGPAQRFRGSMSLAAKGNLAQGRQGDDPGRSRFRRHEVVRFSRHVGFRLRHSVSQQHPRYDGRPSASSG